MNANSWKFIVWERLNKSGKWCPYSAEVSQLIEQTYKKNVDAVCLGDVDENLNIYSVNLKDMVQVSKASGTKLTIRRRLCDSLDSLCNGFTWHWSDSQGNWHPYDIDVNNFIESAFQQGVSGVGLPKSFKGYHYEIDFKKMMQANKQTKKKRPIKRTQNSSPYPATTNSCSSSVNYANPSVAQYAALAKDIPGTAALEDQVNQYMRSVKRTFNGEELDVQPSAPYEIDCGEASDKQNIQAMEQTTNNGTIAAIVNGKPWFHNRPPHTPQSKLKPVPGIDPLAKCSVPKPKKKKAKRGKTTVVETVSEDILDEYTTTVDPALNASRDEDCIICCEPLSSGSSYDNDKTVVQLKLCPHIFHKSCLQAMYNSGAKDKCLQCPVCKKIYGVKCGTQPPGDMTYHVLPYSLPGYTECDTIRIIYDIPHGTQGPEHPNPGKKFTARGFPRHCYLPDNETGRKVLRLLIKAWKRRLIFTIGTSSTTSEENTVTWNEIHHKTEFGCNKREHGFPDPNYFDNVLKELDAHGVTDDDVYLWFAA